MEKKIAFEDHEIAALKDSIDAYLPLLDSYIQNVSSIKHATTADRKDMKKALQRRAEILRQITDRL